MEGVHLHSHMHRHLHGHAHGGRMSVRSLPKDTEDNVSFINTLTAPGVLLDRSAPVQLEPRACAEGDTTPQCEKPVSNASLTVPITLAVVIPIVTLVCVLVYLHRRTAKRHKMEDQDDKYKSLDFGIENSGGSKRKSKLFGGEKGMSIPNHSKQVSMDLNLSSPYLLPPGLQNSRESLNSLARTLHQNEDPYRQVGQLAGNDTSSIRSFSRGPEGSSGHSSVYTGRTYTPGDREGSRTPLGRAAANTPRQLSIQSSFLPQVPAPVRQTSRDEISEYEPSPITPQAKGGFRFTDDEVNLPQIPPATYTAEPLEMPHFPDHEQAPLGREHTPASLPSDSRPLSDESFRGNQNYVAGLVDGRDSAALPPLDLGRESTDGLGIMGTARFGTSPPPDDTVAAASRPPRKESVNALSQGSSLYQDYADQFQFHVEDQDQAQHEDRGRQMAYPDDSDQAYPQEHDYPQSAGLGVPQQQNKRLSVGFRPLPPDEFLESEDPEFRANRIRSFYKEYFDDSKEQRPPMPQLQRAEYYEDYDAGYNGQYTGQHNGQYTGQYDAQYDGQYNGGHGADAAYFDPDSNAFVMPYAQPVTRRAMTPPPNNRMQMPGSRPRGPPGPGGPGPRGGHAPQGSFGAMSMQSGPRGRQRAGSTMSGGRWGPGSPRPGSSASARVQSKPRKPMAPLSTLNTLPTPSKLKDDSFALMGAIDFAPPATFADQAAGRSQSPVGERRPYALNVPISSPLVSAFDEIPNLPSPHLLRKSSTFTALDFAPPRRFKDADSMSDAGSVRSMGSGISSKNLGAIRNGAGRVSRLPGDQVFTQAQMSNTLKPAWSMRD